VGEISSPTVAKPLEFTPKPGTRHQDIHQEGFHSSFSLWRHGGKHRDQGSIPSLRRTFLEDQAGRIS
jgi:hypothetical protein